MAKQPSRAITFHERELIEKYVNKGFSCGQIAKIIGRSKNGVVTEVRRGGGMRYSAKVSQNLMNSKEEARRNKLSEINKGRAGNSPLKRIENLEMQIEILHDTIKELMSR
jgi:IS30 family transposase